MKNSQTTKAHTQIYVSRAERYERTGVAVATQIEMERRGVGPEPLRPAGYGKVMFRWADCIDWMEGRAVPAWAAESTKNKRGDNLRRPGHPRPGRPRKKPKKTSKEAAQVAAGGA